MRPTGCTLCKAVTLSNVHTNTYNTRPYTPSSSLNLGGGSRMGALLWDSPGLPSWPQAAISSSPRLSRMVHTRPACRQSGEEVWG